MAKKKSVQDVRRTTNGTNSELFLRFTQKIHESMTKCSQHLSYVSLVIIIIMSRK